KQHRPGRERSRPVPQPPVANEKRTCGHAGMNGPAIRQSSDLDLAFEHVQQFVAVGMTFPRARLSRESSDANRALVHRREPARGLVRESIEGSAEVVSAQRRLTSLIRYRNFPVLVNAFLRRWPAESCVGRLAYEL